MEIRRGVGGERERERMTGKGVRFDRKVATKGGRDDSFVRHRSIRTCHRGKEGGREKGREGALVCNGAKNYAEMVAMVALNGPDCSNVDILSSGMPVFQRA